MMPRVNTGQRPESWGRGSSGVAAVVPARSRRVKVDIASVVLALIQWEGEAALELLNSGAPLI